MITLKDFLLDVVTPPPPDTKEAYLNISVANPDLTGWRELFYLWPNELDKVVDEVTALAPSHNVYFSVHLFSTRSTKRQYVLPTRTIQVDLDEADISRLPIEPTYLASTSPGRSLAFFVLSGNADDAVPLDETELLSKTLTYAIPKADIGCWSLGHRVRLPFTTNFKYESLPKVEIKSRTIKRVDPHILSNLPQPNSRDIINDPTVVEWVNEPIADWSKQYPPAQIVEELFKAGKLTPKVYYSYNLQAADRSKAMWALYHELFDAGLPREMVCWLASRSHNANKFKHDRDLKKDVVRAELDHEHKQDDLKDYIQRVMKDKNHGSDVERMQQVSRKIIEDMVSRGRFFHDVDGFIWYVSNETAMPLQVANLDRNTAFAVFLNANYGVNATTHVAKFVTHEIITYASQAMPSTEVVTLSYYDTSSNKLMLHGGGKEVIIISADGVTTAQNGSLGDVLFTWRSVIQQFKPDFNSNYLEKPWYRHLYEDGLSTILNMDKEEALALLAVWTIYTLMRNSIASWPIMLLVGEPGSGKSTLPKITYRLLYGKFRNLQSLGTPDEYDLTTSIHPVVCLDNVDTFTAWLQDRLATSTGGGERIKRELYTDKGLIYLKREAMIMITSMAPKFGRADVADRIVTLEMGRLPVFISETYILSGILEDRNAIWAGIINSIQTVLRTPKPHHNDPNVPQLRIQDFAYLGYWIATAMGISDAFKSALERIKNSQQNIVLEDEHLLVEALRRWCKRNPDRGFIKAAQLYNELVQGPSMNGHIVPEPYVDDVQTFTRAYRGGQSFASKLTVIHNVLRRRFDIQYRPGEAKTWQIKLLPEDNLNAKREGNSQQTISDQP